MIQALITAAIASPLILYINKKRNGLLDGFSVVAFVAVPYIAVFLLSLALTFLEFSIQIALVFHLFFFVVPVLMCRYQFECTWGVGCQYGGIVMGAHVLVSVVFMMLLTPAV